MTQNTFMLTVEKSEHTRYRRTWSWVTSKGENIKRNVKPCCHDHIIWPEHTKRQLCLLSRLSKLASIALLSTSTSLINVILIAILLITWVQVPSAWQIFVAPPTNWKPGWQSYVIWKRWWFHVCAENDAADCFGLFYTWHLKDMQSPFFTPWIMSCNKEAR